MSDVDDKWSTEAADAAPRKRRLPGWLLGCGIGCGLMLVLGVLLSFLVYRGMARMMDPERQWAALEEAIPVAERPPGATLVGLPWWMKFSVQGYRAGWSLTAADEASTATILLLEANPENPVWKAMFEIEGQAGQVEFFGSVGFHDPELGSLATQGRDLRVLRYRTMPLDGQAAAEEPARDEGSGEESVFHKIRAGIEASLRASAARVDLTPEPPGDGFLVLEYRKPGSLERVSDEELADFLEIFDLVGH